MRWLWLALAVLGATVALGAAITAWPGVVAISVGGQVIRLSLALFACLAIVGTLLGSWLLRLTWRLLTIRTRYRRWQAQRQARLARQDLERGLLAMAAGDHAKAERFLGRGKNRSTLHYLAAAQAAHAQQAPARRDALLALAQPRHPEESLALAVRRAGMLLDDGDIDGASSALATLSDRAARQPQALELRHRLLAATGQYDAIGELLPVLRKQKVYPTERLAALETETAVRRLLGCSGDHAALARCWSGLPRRQRELPEVAATYARVLVQGGAHAMAEEILRKGLAQHWSPALVALYGELDANVARPALGRAEEWLAQHPQDPVLLLALARLCCTQQLWGKARSYLDTVLAIQPTPLAHRLLADVLDQLGEPELARQQRAKGLACAVEGRALPTP